MPAATASQASCLRLEITTLAPCAASASAIAFPMPLVEPVTTATLPCRSNRSFTPSSLSRARSIAVSPADARPGDDRCAPRARSGPDMDDAAPRATLPPVLPEEHSLPGAQREPRADDRNRERGRGQR